MPSQAKQRSQFKHQRKRSADFKAAYGKTWAEMTDEERRRVRQKFSPAYISADELDETVIGGEG